MQVNKDSYFGVITDAPLLSNRPWLKDVMFGDTGIGRKRSTSESRSNGSPENDPVINWDTTDYDGRTYRSTRRATGPSLPASSATGSSIASSDLSENCCDIDLELSSESSIFGQVSFDSDFINSSSLMPIMEGCSITDNSLVGAISWSDSELDIHETPHASRPCSMTSMPSSPQSSRKRPASPSTILNHKAWSAMTLEEQKTCIKHVTQLISTQMDLREQLEVIKILSPETRISPTDKEFVITLESLNDDKLDRIREAIKRHEKNAAELRFSMQKTSKKRMSRTRSREFRQRQRKEQRQAMKEQRSGLFHREQVLPLKSCDSSGDSEIEVDIID